MVIKLNRKQLDYMNSNKPNTGFVAGLGSGKSYAATLKTIVKKLQNPTLTVAYYLPTYPLIRDIAFSKFPEMLSEMGIEFVLNKTDKEIAQEQAEDDDTDPFLMDAIQTVVETGQASTSFIQRRFKVGYARAGRIIDQMEERGVISGYQGSKPREVLMTKERWEELKMGTSEENKN